MKTKKLLLLLFAVLCLKSLMAADVVLNNFESGSPTTTARSNGTYVNVANPTSSGINTTANCGKVGRVDGSTTWWAMVYFPASFTVAANTTKYLHIMVKYAAQPDIAIRVDATSAGATGTADIRATNSYTNYGQWQDMVFAITAGATAKNIIQINFLVDMGFSPPGLILNNTTAFGYMDEVILSDNDLPRGTTYMSGNSIYNFEGSQTGNITGISTYADANNPVTYPFTNPFSSGINTSTNVGKRTANLANPATWYAGFTFSLTNPMLIDASHRYLHVMMSVPVNGQKVTFNVLQGATTKIADAAGLATITTANTWQDVVFDLSAMQYLSKIAIKCGNYNTNSTAAGNYYFDDIYIDGNSAPRGGTITTSTSSLSGMNFSYGDGPSSEATFTVGGTSLANDLTLTAASPYEISTTSSTGFSGSLTLTKSGSSVSTTTIYTRLGTAANVSYTGGSQNFNNYNIIISSLGSNSKTVTCNGTLSPRPLTVSDATTTNKEYDASNVISVGGSLAGGIIGSDVVSLASTGTAADANVGTEKTVTYSITGANVTKYSLTQPVVTANITAKALTVSSPVANNKVYDGNNSAIITGTLTGKVGVDDVTIVGTGTFADVNVATNIAVTSTSTLGGTKAGNYSLTQPTGLTANITAASSPIAGGNLNDPALTAELLANTNLTISSGEFIINDTKTVRSLTVAPGAKLTHSSGTLTATNGITLESDATGTATLMDSYTEPTITATVKQYVTAGRNWYISAPLNNTADYSVLDKGASVAEYNEITGLWPEVTSGTLTRGKGYVQVASATQGTTGTVSFSGTTNSGDVPATLTYTSDKGKGFNLVGNPYPSYLSWSAVAADNAAANMPTGTMWYRTISYNEKSAWTPSIAYSLNDIVYNGIRFYKVTTAGTSAASGGPSGTGTSISDGSVVWNYEGSIYIFATISASGVASPATVSNLIPPMQAFWVKSTGGTLTFKNTMRSHNTGGTNALKAPKNATKDIKLIRLNVSNGASADEAVIYASTNASNTFDIYDAPKYFNTAGSNQPEIYTQVDAEKLVINAMNELNEGAEIPLGFATEKGNNFSISASELINFGSDIKVMLKDKQTATEFDLSTGQSYAFSSIVVNSTDRFSLILRSPGIATGIDIGTKLNVQVFVNAANQIAIIAPEKSDYVIYNAMGQKQDENSLTSTNTTIKKAFGPGVYFVALSVNGQREIQKVIIR